ncbi:DUF2690 domain-containing protein [Lentzea albidocapillata]|uniref:DUF2690 domain-containing protein n=1 Tax=Lentzea albidocapillata TaxID=40571 RepID=A0A1W2FSH3_9PSEU|nr:DUF2690 domain-containing protein [Lentzea albidocapillata]SMD24576.1 Protein of unknown function [Lentzea albidocapillata]
MLIIRSRTPNVLFLVLAMMGTLVFGTGTATAAPCVGPSCHGQNPQSTGCANDAVTKIAKEYKQENQSSWRAEMRYSPSCRAAWYRQIVYSGRNLGFHISAWNPGGASVEFAGAADWIYTKMVNASSGVEACGGAQFYTYDQWRRWNFLGCFRG